VYVTPKSIKNICEISASGAPLLGDDYYLNVSGIRYDYDPSNDLFEKDTEVYLCDAADINTESCTTSLDVEDDTTRYRVVVNLYALEMMEVTTTFGIPVVARNETGTPISSADYENYRIDTSADAGVQELKKWMALNYFLETLYPYIGTGIPENIYGQGGTALGRANDVSAP